jgi:hypothetical protein
MKKCTRCFMRYCSDACAKQHWQQHKPVCRALDSWLATHRLGEEDSRKSKKYAKTLRQGLQDGMGFAFVDESSWRRSAAQVRQFSIDQQD